MRWLALLLLPLCANADFYIEGGPTNLSYDWAGHSYILTERQKKFDFSLGWVSKQNVHATCGPHLPRSERCWFDIRQNMFVSVQRIARIKRCELGVGPAYFANKSRVTGSHLIIGVMAGCNLSNHIFVRFRHYSNAGIASPNLGLDLFTIGYRF
jgi:hypothetical protein